jgi:hypothetical protein
MNDHSLLGRSIDSFKKGLHGRLSPFPKYNFRNTFEKCEPAQKVLSPIRFGFHVKACDERNQL